MVRLLVGTTFEKGRKGSRGKVEAGCEEREIIDIESNWKRKKKRKELLFDRKQRISIEKQKRRKKNKNKRERIKNSRTIK